MPTMQDAALPIRGTASRPDTRGLRGRWLARTTGGQTGPPDGPLLDRILASRGLAGPDARDFLHPKLVHLHDPALLPNAERAARRILDAAHAGETIAIYGDYDVDGVTASAILTHALRAVCPGVRLVSYIPHRVDEGYGLNTPALRQLIEDDGARVIVSVDCGITAREPVAAAAALGADIIITDHHNPPESDDPLPGAYAVVHPRLPGSAYPFGELCGAGVAYKLAWLVMRMARGSKKLDPEGRRLLLDLLAFAALGTVADVVPLSDENRAICRHGLTMIRTSRFVGLRALTRASGLDDGEKVREEDVGFRLAPRLNACGRLGHAREAFRLMITDDADEAEQIADELTRLNTRRQSTERKIVDQAAELAESAGMTGDDRRAIVLCHDDWHPGVIGIVCSRLVERFCRPTLLLSRQAADDGTVTLAGSGRSIDGFNLHAALEACSEHLTTFGGHDMAAGLRLAGDRYDAFCEHFIATANERLTPDDLVRSFDFDAETTIGELTPHVIGSLDAIAPFGRANPGVRLRLNGLQLDAVPRIFGKQANHAELRVRGPGGVLSLTGWSWAEELADLPRGARLEALVQPAISTYRGRVEVKPTLVDVRVTG